MLTKLIQALCNHGHSHAAALKRIEQNWQEWLMPIASHSDVGDDLCYDDDFLIIKEEVTKVTGSDIALVITLSQTLLCERSKDLRVAAYYAWAQLRENGLKGLIEGFELIAGLIHRYGESLFPKRLESKTQALEWLSNDKFIDCLRGQQPLSHDDLACVISALSLVTSYTEHWPQDRQPDLGALVRFFETQLEISEAEQKATHTEPLSKPLLLAEQQHSELPHSVQDALTQTRQLALYLRQKSNGYLAAMRLQRTVRWDTVMTLPPHDAQGMTRLVAPRKELKQSLNRLLLQQAWLALLEQVESAFVEAANHFWLDLQRYAALAMYRLGAPYAQWQEICATDVALMLDRLNGIAQLTYRDGTPFADDETRAWIATSATLRRLDEGEALAPVPLEDGDGWAEIQQQAMEMAERDGLDAAFTWLAGVPNIVTERQQYLHRMVFAALAEHKGQRDVAIRLLTALNEKSHEYCLARWEPDLMFEVQARLLKLLQHQSTLKNSDKTVLRQQVEMLLAEMTKLHPARALTYSLV